MEKRQSWPKMKLLKFKIRKRLLPLTGDRTKCYQERFYSIIFVTLDNFLCPSLTSGLIGPETLCFQLKEQIHLLEIDRRYPSVGMLVYESRMTIYSPLMRNWTIIQETTRSTLLFWQAGIYNVWKTIEHLEIGKRVLGFLLEQCWAWLSIIWVI